MNDVFKKRWSSVISNGDFILVQTCSGYRSGIWDAREGEYIFGLDVTDAALGEVVFMALSKSRFVLPEKRDDVWQHPEAAFDPELFDYRKSADRYQVWVDDLIRRLGCRSRRALFKRMMYCSIVDSVGVLTFEPMRHVKLEAWESMRDEVESVVIPAESDPADVASAVHLALSRCV